MQRNGAIYAPDFDLWASPNISPGHLEIRSTYSFYWIYLDY